RSHPGVGQRRPYKNEVGFPPSCIAPSSSLRALLFLSALAPGISLSAVFAQASTSVTATAEAHRKEQDAALNALDAAIARFEAFVNRVTDVQHKAVSKSFLDDFKERRSTLRRAYDQAAYNDLKLDLQIESQRLATWLVTTTMSVPVGNAERATDIFYLRGPPPADPAETKSALEALDREIKRLEQRIHTVPAGPARDVEKLRLGSIEKRRAEFGEDPTRSRWDALVSELKKQWETHPR
ncbi:MAG: hypothetical protein ACREH8_21405, partial [Opitutaceae bacterium]